MSFDNANAAPRQEPVYDAGNAALTSQSHNLMMPNHHHRPDDTKVVQDGDTLGAMAQHHLGHHANVHDVYNYVNQIGKANHIQNVNKIHPGETIYFPPFHHIKHANHDAGRPHAHQPADVPVVTKPAVTAPQAGAEVQPVKPQAAATQPGGDLKPDIKPVVPQPGAQAAAPGGDVKPVVVQPGATAALPGGDAKPAVVQTVAPAAGPAAAPGGEVKPVVAVPQTPGSAPLSNLIPQPRESALTAIGHGISEELSDNPGGVVADLGLGAAVVAASRFMPGWVKPAMLGLGLAATAYEAYENGGALAQSARVESNPDAYSAAEQKASNETLHGLGHGITDFTAGAVGGGIAGLTSSVLRGGGSGVFDSMLAKIGIGKAPLYDAPPTFTGATVEPVEPIFNVGKAPLSTPANDNIPLALRPLPALTGPARLLALPAPESRLALPAPAEQLALPAPDAPKLLSGPGSHAALTAPAEQLALPAHPEQLALPAPDAPKLLSGPGSHAALTATAEQPALPAPAEQLALPAPAEQLALPAPAEQLALPAHPEQPALPTHEAPKLLTGPENSKGSAGTSEEPQTESGAQKALPAPPVRLALPPPRN